MHVPLSTLGYGQELHASLTNFVAEFNHALTELELLCINVHVCTYLYKHIQELYLHGGLTSRTVLFLC